MWLQIVLYSESCLVAFRNRPRDRSIEDRSVEDRGEQVLLRLETHTHTMGTSRSGIIGGLQNLSLTKRSRAMLRTAGIWEWSVTGRTFPVAVAGSAGSKRNCFGTCARHESGGHESKLGELNVYRRA